MLRKIKYYYVIFICFDNFSIVGQMYLTEAESLSIVYRFFTERWPDHLFPKTILVFDNACKLVQYILNRDTNLMNGMIIMTDRFHGEQRDNHNTCPSSTHYEYYRVLLQRWGLCNYFDKLNTANAEQINSKLRHMAQSCRQAKMSNYMLFIDNWATLNNLLYKSLLTDGKENERKTIK